MNHFQKYLELIDRKKEYKGGDLLPKLDLNENKCMNNPNVWFLSNNSFYRNPLILKLIKLPPDVLLRKVFNKNTILYTQFINLLFIQLNDSDKLILQTYKKEYNKYLDPYVSASFRSQLKNESAHLVFITKLIEYFRETYVNICILLDISKEQDPVTAREMNQHFKLFETP
jgi:hypothetical protein